MAEREGFEPPCRLPGKTLSRRPRYDHFGTSPFFGSATLVLRGSLRVGRVCLPELLILLRFRASCLAALLEERLHQPARLLRKDAAGDLDPMVQR